MLPGERSERAAHELAQSAVGLRDGPEQEADLHEHEEGLLAHGQVARMIFETMLQGGLTWFRPGWGAEYCCLTNADYVAMFHDGVYKHSKALEHFD